MSGNIFSGDGTPLPPEQEALLRNLLALAATQPGAATTICWAAGGILATHAVRSGQTVCAVLEPFRRHVEANVLLQRQPAGAVQ